MELLRAYAQVFSSSSYWLSFQMPAAYENRIDGTSAEIVVRYLTSLKDEADRLGLVMTFSLAVDAIEYVGRWNTESGCPLLYESIRQLCDILERELAQQLFIKISSERRSFYDEPFRNWGLVTKRFGEVMRDVEEMNKCFALSRYTAAMFHAMQIAEAGAIALGEYVGVTDPKLGWDATKRKLAELVNQGHLQLPEPLKEKFDFLERMHREVETMTMAWRNKIDHVANRLAIVPNTDFTPDIAEHVMSSVRIFMLRLAEGLPAGGE